MYQPKHLLVIDDNPEIREVIHEYFTQEGFRVSLAADGRGMREVLNQGSVDLILLDVRLPGEDGLTLAADLRRETEAGIIMLSQKDELVDRVAGLEVGADDYVAKPFELRELLARVRSVLRRSQTDPPETSPAGSATSQPSLRFNGYEFDLRKRVLVAPSGEPVELSPGEFDLLAVFLEHPKRALSRDQILDYARGRAAAPFERSIDVQVGRLRRKIETNPRRPDLIKTVRGVGYLFDGDLERR